jgi:hypothetical protein
MDHIDRLARPGILPLVDDLAGRGIQIHHDFARHAAEADAALRIGDARALPRVDPDHGEDQSVTLRGCAAVQAAFPHAIARHALFRGAAGRFRAPLDRSLALADFFAREQLRAGERCRQQGGRQQAAQRNTCVAMSVHVHGLISSPLPSTVSCRATPS